MKEVCIFLAGVLVGLIGRYLFILCVNNCKSKDQNINVEDIEEEIFKFLRLSDIDKSKIRDALNEERKLDKYKKVKFFNKAHIDYSICVIQKIHNNTDKNYLVHYIFRLKKEEKNRCGGFANENFVSLISLIIGIYGMSNKNMGDIVNGVCVVLFFIIILSIAAKFVSDFGIERQKKIFYFDIIEMVI